MAENMRLILAAAVVYVTLVVGPVKRIGEYTTNRFGGARELWGPGIAGKLVDDNNDRLPDRKYLTVGGGVHGCVGIERPITEQDKQLFYDIVLQLEELEER